MHSSHSLSSRILLLSLLSFTVVCSNYTHAQNTANDNSNENSNEHIKNSDSFISSTKTFSSDTEAKPEKADETDNLMLDEVVVTGTTQFGEQDYAQFQPKSVTYLSNKELAQKRVMSVGDIFADETGVLVGENRNSGGLDVNIRGMQGQGRVPVLIDGTRQESTVYRGYAGAASRSYLDPDLMSSVAITKGAVIDTAGATGGVVKANTLEFSDIVKKSSNDENVNNDEKDFGIRLNVQAIGNNSKAPSAGTYAGYYLPQLSYNSDCVAPRLDYCSTDKAMPDSFAPKHGMKRPKPWSLQGYSFNVAAAKRFENLGIFDNVDVIGAYSQRQQGNYYTGKKGKTPQVIIGNAEQDAWYKKTKVTLDSVSPFRGGERIPNTQFANKSVLLKFDASANEEHNIKMGFVRFNGNHGEMMPSQINLFGQARQWLDTDVTNNIYTLGYNWQPYASDWEDLVDVELDVWHTDTKSIINTPKVSSNNISDNVKGFDRYKRWGVELNNTSRFYPLGQLNVKYGVAVHTEEKNAQSSTKSGFYANSRKGKRKEFSSFGMLDWSWEKFSVSSGLRYTRFDVQDDNYLKLSVHDPNCISDGNNGCLPLNKYHNSASGLSPMFSFGYEPLDGLKLYYRFTRAQRMPSLFESTTGFSVSPSLDIRLKPETATHQEIGVNFLQSNIISDKDKLRAKLVYFDNSVKDYITRTQPNSWETPKPDLRANYFRVRNIKSLDLKGIEANINYDASKWFIELGATKYTDIEVCNVGSYVRYYCTDWGITQGFINNMIPPNYNATLHTGMRLLDNNLTLGVRHNLIGTRNKVPQYNADTGFNKPLPWQKYQTTSLYMNYAVSPYTELSFNVDNAFDTYYLDTLSLATTPAPGRSLRLGVTTYF